MHNGLTISPFLYPMKFLTPSSSLNSSEMTILFVSTWFK